MQNKVEELKVCTRCVLDTTVENITFDDKGVCNYCLSYDKFMESLDVKTPEQKKTALAFNVDFIKRAGKGDKYDCILGVSGGVDSSYLAYVVKQFGLRPLVVHFDNSWNSELAIFNIEQIINKLGLDLHTYVINWEEFRDIQVAYLKASVVDVEVPTDQYILAVLYKLASEYNIKYILSGYNYATEYGMPYKWNFPRKWDQVNLLNIHKKFGTIPLKDFPKFGNSKKIYYREVKGIEQVSLLNYMDYDKKKAKEVLIKELGWRDYGGKHHESVFTKFYQSYILPNKFNIDKRKAHWSSLICSGQASREEALADIKKPFYASEDLMKEEKDYVLKKLGLAEAQFNVIMKLAPVPHEYYGLEHETSGRIKLFLGLLIFIPSKILAKIRFIRKTGKWRIKQ